MPANPFDKAARYLAKMDHAMFFAWATGLPVSLPGRPSQNEVFRSQAGGFAFDRWLDTRAVPLPNEPDQIGDTVACVRNTAVEEPPWAVAIEFQIEPDALMFGRMLCYLGQLWLTLKPDDERGSRFNVAGIVVNLTGTGRASQNMRWPDAGFVTQFGIVERNLASENADDLLAGIEGGRWSRAVLPWLPLMIGGDKPDIIDRWKALADGEPNRRHKADYAVLAVTFAGAVKRKDIWEKALEGWNMIESEVANEWMAVGKAKGLAEGKAEGRTEQAASAVVAVLEAKYGRVPAEMEAKIRGTADLLALQGWVPLAVTTATLAEFRHTAGL